MRMLNGKSVKGLPEKILSPLVIILITLEGLGMQQIHYTRLKSLLTSKNYLYNDKLIYSSSKCIRLFATSIDCSRCNNYCMN